MVAPGGGWSSQEESAYLPGFPPGRVHLLLKVVYRGYPHHNDGLHLGGGFLDGAIWNRHWLQLAAQSASWYVTPSGSVGRWFAAILVVGLQGVLNMRWKS